MTERLFVYGSLRQESAQRDVLGRVPDQRREEVAGFRRGTIAGGDPAVVSRLGRPHWDNLEPDRHGRIDGILLDLDQHELALVDAHERRDGYVRVSVTLSSGASGWVYVHETSEARRILDVSGDLRSVVERAGPLLAALADADTARRPAEGTWAPREVIGHLVDSAMVNHERFLRARWQDDLVFEGYDQEARVAAHAYAATDWVELLQLWRALNLHVARVIDTTPAAVRTTSHARHSLDRIAFGPVRPQDPTTLDVLMRDYVAHLRHHLAQVLGPAWEDRRTVACRLEAIRPFFIVEDLRVSVAFYRERLGFQLDYEGPAGDVYYAGLSRDGAGVLLKTIHPDVRPCPNHSRHPWARWDAYVYTRDPDALYDEFRQRGVTFTRALSFIDDGLWGFELEDADGYVLAFFEARSQP